MINLNLQKVSAIFILFQNFSLMK